MGTRRINQMNPPLPEKKRVDSKGNDARRLFVKIKGNQGNATLQLAWFPTENSANLFVEKLQNTAKSFGGKCTCDFLVAK